MADYYVNQRAQANGDHEVHRHDCAYLPALRTYLGDHASCFSAVAQARRFLPTANGCYFCSPACHTG